MIPECAPPEVINNGRLMISGKYLLRIRFDGGIDNELNMINTQQLKGFPCNTYNVNLLSAILSTKVLKPARMYF